MTTKMHLLLRSASFLQQNLRQPASPKCLHRATQMVRLCSTQAGKVHDTAPVAAVCLGDRRLSRQRSSSVSSAIVGRFVDDRLLLRRRPSSVSSTIVVCFVDRDPPGCIVADC
ncbi:hypothetical protein FJT64_011450 [Amphibalanus amphitrite]|nr:hypothetical protein FJT64_011450 [Amphibalanus amphitrite]